MTRISLVPVTLLLSMTVACATADSDIEDMNDAMNDLPVEDVADLWWDDPDNAPDVDRWAPNGTPISIPLGTSAAESEAMAIVRGEGSNDRLGVSVASVGDLNGDSVGDIVIGSNYDTATKDGAAYMEKGPITNFAANQRADGLRGRWYGETSGKAGEFVGGGGDIDGNGKNEFLIGSRGRTSTTDTWKLKGGGVFLVYGFEKGKKNLDDVSWTVLEGEFANDLAGSSPDIAGDIDGDGTPDILTGAIQNDNNGSNSGAVYLVSGAGIAGTMSLSDADGIIAGEDAGDQAGARVRGIGDYDGDGLDDFAAGVKGNDQRGTDAGAVYILTSSTLPTDLSDADVIIRGNLAGSAAGSALADVGDFDGDGLDDLFVGSQGHGGKGAAYLIPGGAGDGIMNTASTSRFSGQLSGDQFGSSVAGGDWDGDGQIDLMVGANRQSSTSRGAVYIFLNPGTGLTAAFSADSKVVGGNTDDYLGSAIAYVAGGDWAGRDYLMLGASGRGSNDKGSVYFFQE